MSANFYNASGKMVGLDLHPYWAVPGVYSPLWPYVVGAPFSWLLDDSGARISAVTSNGKPTCQGSMELVCVPHVPIPIAPPHPAEALQIVSIVSTSGSKPALAVASVTGAGKPLAACLEGAFGLNLNCWEGWKLPTGIVLQSNTVMTQPTAGDFASAVFDAVVDNLISKVSSKLSKPLANKLKLGVPKEILKEIVKRDIKEIKKKCDKPVKDIAYRFV